MTTENNTSEFVSVSKQANGVRHAQIHHFLLAAVMLATTGLGTLGCSNASGSDSRKVKTAIGSSVDVPWWLDADRMERPYREPTARLLREALHEIDVANVPPGWTVKIEVPAWPVKVAVDPREGLNVSHYAGLVRGLTDPARKLITVGIRVPNESGPALPALLYEVEQAWKVENDR